MKIRKKTAMLLSLAVGTTIFATTAMAEVASKSGYEQMKDVLKYSSASFSEKLSNYTIDLSYVVRDNGSVLYSQEDVHKYDVKKAARENTSTMSQGTGKETTNYYYSDSNGFINYSSDRDTYYVTEYQNPENGKIFNDPFKEESAADIEKIVDAFVGNLKDYVVVSEKADGSKELSGSLSQVQIPALANAILSFQFKSVSGMQQSPDNKNVLPKLVKDIYVKEVKGNMTTDKDGLIQKVLATGILSGKDEAGKEHNLSVDILAKVDDINSTTVARPDLTGKNVEKSVQNNYSETINLERYVGEYKNDIIIVKDGKFEKVGERIINITSIADNNITGRYHEEFAQGYEDYTANKKDFNFNAAVDKNNKGYAVFSYKDAKGNSNNGNINIDNFTANIYFYIDGNEDTMNNGTYNRVFK